MTVDSNEELAVACVGLGYFSQFHLDGWNRIDGVRLAAVCDKAEGVARAAAALLMAESGVGGIRDFADLSDMLTAVDPDILDIVTPPPTHADFVRAAMTRPDGSGRTIICQKPFCRDLEEARAVAADAKAAGATVVVHENFRFQPWHRAARDVVASGALGTIHQATFRLRPGDGQGPDAYLARQPFFREMPRLLIHETAIHFIDVFRFLLGDATAVYADLRRLNPVIAGEDAGLMIMTHASGARSVFDGDRLVDHVAENRRKTMGELLIEGDAGVLRLDGDGRLFQRMHGDNHEAAVPLSYEDRGFGGDCVKALQEHVVQHLREGAPIENDADAYLRNIEIEEAAYRSNDAGARVTL